MRMLITTLAIAALFAGSALADIQDRLENGEELSTAVQAELAEGTELTDIISYLAKTNPDQLPALIDVIAAIAPDQLTAATNLMLDLVPPENNELIASITGNAVANGVPMEDISEGPAAGPTSQGTTETTSSTSDGSAGAGGGGGVSQN